MKKFIIITLIFICNSINANATSELEIGVIQFEEAKGSQIYNQLVRFDTPFAKPPQVAIALVEHTSTTALFAKVKNVTQHDFIIQFFSAVSLNATYRYLATTDDDVYINCSNYRATQQAIFKYPQFQTKPNAIAFLVGYHHNGFVNISINENSNTQANLSINTNDVQQTAIGICLIVGSNLQFDANVDTPKFSHYHLHQVQQSSGQAKQKIEESLTDLKTFFDQNSNTKEEETEQSIQISEELEPQNVEDLEECQQKLNDNIIEESISDDLGEEEEDDEYFWSSKDKKQQQSSVDFELQLTLLQDALKKKPQIQQQTIKELIKKNSSNQKEQKQKQVKKDEIQKKNKPALDQEIKSNDNVKNTETQILNNEEIDMQLQQKESHVKSLKKALKLVDTAKEKVLEVILPQIESEKQLSQELNEVKAENNQQEILEVTKPIGYQSPLIDEIPKIEEIIEVKQKEKKFTQKLDGYMQSFSEDTYTQKVQKKKQQEQVNKIESNNKETMEQIQLIQLTGQSHSTKVVYEASEDSLRKFEEDFERRKQEKMKEIKQQLIPENKPTKVKFLSLAQEDEQLRSYKDFFYN
ncbi:unnamed protein product (macronuclear) [Paramecium tetraurelia]|uniref:H-type lectin domain-containing protein n=1 Tax=Paramecium tetraurelia TaxID=5888 RepID=A0BZY9_PARTE|nr:uncharacterized protein GSPATT00005958001 [Paramecium tetraurelia]CAK64106.1 unnamed protein product [Paramecium tetraurelia]|eukprot:XP_001431504.1 hypothetical protein (macronuclear) [Paramecium tetraurelia strain d4-2]